jgi:hypothetical protein
MRSLGSQWAGWWAAVALLLPACAAVPRDTEALPALVSVFGRSHNRSDVDVYLLCGSRDARWLGVISRKGAEGFEIPAAATRCLHGLNFFLVVREQGRGYWVGPVRPRPGQRIELDVSKYAGLSTVRVRG